MFVRENFLEIFSCSGRKVEQLIKLAKHINFLDLIICWTAMMCFDKVIFKTRDFAKNRIDSHTFCGHINTDGIGISQGGSSGAVDR